MLGLTLSKISEDAAVEFQSFILDDRRGIIDDDATVPFDGSRVLSSLPSHSFNCPTAPPPRSPRIVGFRDVSIPSEFSRLYLG